MKTRTEILSIEEEKIRFISGRAKDDDGGGAPFYEMPCFETIEEALAWTSEARANPAQYRYIKVDVEIDVKETLYYDDGSCVTYYSRRDEQPYVYNANVDSDAEFYERLKGYGQLGPDQWVAVRNGVLLACTDNEAEAWHAALHNGNSIGRALVRQVGHERGSGQDERSVAEIVQQIARMARKTT